MIECDWLHSVTSGWFLQKLSLFLETPTACTSMSEMHYTHSKWMENLAFSPQYLIWSEWGWTHPIPLTTSCRCLQIYFRYELMISSHRLRVSYVQQTARQCNWNYSLRWGASWQSLLRVLWDAPVLLILVILTHCSFRNFKNERGNCLVETETQWKATTMAEVKK